MKIGVVLADDKECIRKGIRRILQHADGIVLLGEACDGEEAICLVERTQPDVVLMDIQLPGMDGLSATRCIKSDEELKNVPVIALTSYAMATDQQKAIEAGCSGHISKPFRIKEFLLFLFFYQKVI